MFPYTAVIEKGADRAKFIRFLKRNKIEFEAFEGLPRHFLVAEPVQHDAVLRFGLADKPAHHAGHYVDLELDPDFTGANWGNIRTNRRDAPWKLARFTYPMDQHYQAEATGLGVDIYIVDSGIKTTHAEFKPGQAINQYDFWAEGTGDGFGHGTACASIAGGMTVGYAVDATLWSFKCFTSAGDANSSSILTSLSQVATHYSGRSGTNRPAVLNLSLVGASSDVSAALEDLIDMGIFVTVPAGNDNYDLDLSGGDYVAKTPGALCCGGSNPADGPYYYNGDDGSYFSGGKGTNYGSAVHILAPASKVWVAAIANNNAYRAFTGTSFACASAAGVVACLLQGHDRLADATEVAAVHADLLVRATVGRFNDWGPTPIGRLPDKLLYMEHKVTFQGHASGGGDATGNVFNAAESDPFWSLVVLMCHFEGTEGQITTIDNSLSAHTITRNGSPYISTAEADAGESSSFHNDVWNNTWYAANSEEFAFDDDTPFTIEASVFLNDTGDFSLLGVWGTTGGNCDWFFFSRNPGELTFTYYDTTVTNRTVSGSWSHSANQWYKLCADYDGANIRIYADGVMIAKAARVGSFAIGSTSPLRIGGIESNTSYAMPGYIDEVRITKGAARYHSDDGYDVPDTDMPDDGPDTPPVTNGAIRGTVDGYESDAGAPELSLLNPGILAGDLVVIFMTTLAGAFTATGWTLIASQTNAEGGNTFTTAAYYRYATSGDIAGSDIVLNWADGVASVNEVSVTLVDVYGQPAFNPVRGSDTSTGGSPTITVGGAIYAEDIDVAFSYFAALGNLPFSHTSDWDTVSSDTGASYESLLLTQEVPSVGTLAACSADYLTGHNAAGMQVVIKGIRWFVGGP